MCVVVLNTICRYSLVHQFICCSPCIRKHKNHSKASSGAGRFVQNIRAYKKSQHNVCNCKLVRHNQLHTFWRRNSQHKPTLTKISYNGLKVKGKKNGKTKIHLLVDKIKCFVLLIFVKIILFVDL